MSQCSTAGPDPLEVGSSLPRKRCLTINEWCKAYGLSRSTFYNLVASGELKAIRLAGRTLVTVDEAEAYLARAVAVATCSGIKPAA